MGLGLGCAGRGAAAQPFQFGLGQIAPGGFLGGVPFNAGGTAFEVGVVAAVVHVALAAVDLQHTVGEPGQQVTVMGDQHQRTAKRHQSLLKPGDGVEIQVVGGFVKHQQVGVGDQCPRQCNPLGLPTRHAIHRHIGQPTHAQAVQHRSRLPRPRPGGLFHCRQGGTGGKVALLVEHGHAHVTTHHHPARLRQFVAGQNAQQGGLAGAVHTQHAEAVAGGNGDREVVKQRLARPAGGHTLEVNTDHPPRVGPLRWGRFRALA